MGFHEETRDLDVVYIENLAIPCVVGIYPHEKASPQPVVANLRLYLDRDGSRGVNSIGDTVDYGALAAEINFIMQQSRFALLETAAEAIAAYILAPPAPDKPRALVRGVDIDLKKPLALHGNARPGVRYRRLACEIAEQKIKTVMGNVEVLHENRGCTLYRLSLPAGYSTPAFIHDGGDVAEMALSEGLTLQGRSVPSGLAHLWPGGLPRCYENPTGKVRSLLCVSPVPFKFFSLYLTAKDRSHLTPLPVQLTQLYYPEHARGVDEASLN